MNEPQYPEAAETVQTTDSPAVAAATACSPSVVIVVPLDAPESSLAELRAGGFIPVQTDKPDSVRMITPGANIVGNDMLMSTMHALCHTPYLGADAAKAMRAEMVKELYRRTLIREANEKSAGTDAGTEA